MKSESGNRTCGRGHKRNLCFYVFLCQNAVMTRGFILGMGFRIWDLGMQFTSGHAMGHATGVVRVAAAGLTTQPRSVSGLTSARQARRHQFDRAGSAAPGNGGVGGCCRREVHKEFVFLCVFMSKGNVYAGSLRHVIRLRQCSRLRPTSARQVASMRRAVFS